MTAAVFLDRDGVIARDTGYPHDPDTIQFMPGAPEAVRRLNVSGYKVIITTNQSGVGRGYFNLAQMHAYNDALKERLRQKANAEIDAIYFCPFHPDAVEPQFRHGNHPDRKPNPGMINRAIADHKLLRPHCFLIGDRKSDIAAAEAAGIHAILYKGENLLLAVERGVVFVEAERD